MISVAHQQYKNISLRRLLCPLRIEALIPPCGSPMRSLTLSLSLAPQAYLRQPKKLSPKALSPCARARENSAKPLVATRAKLRVSVNVSNAPAPLTTTRWRRRRRRLRSALHCSLVIITREREQKGQKKTTTKREKEKILY